MAITLFLGYQLTSLKADFEFEKFFPTDDPDIAFYEEHLASFGYDNDYIVVVLENRTGVFDSTFLNKTLTLAEQLREIQFISQVTSPLELKQLIQGPLGVTAIPIINVDLPRFYVSDSIRIFSHPIYKTFFSADAQSIIIHLTHEHIKDPVASAKLMSVVEETVNSFSFDKTRLIGKLIAQEEFVDYIKKDFVKYIGLALLVCFVLLIVIFRSFKVALMPYLISITSLVWLLGLMALLGEQITILGSLIPPVILFVSSSDAIHLIKAYSRINAETPDRLSLAVSNVFMPTALTSITTAIGFISLLAIDTTPIKSLGVFCGIGVLIAFVVTFVFGPLLIQNQHRKEESTSKFYKVFTIWLLRNYKPVLAANAIVIALAAWGASKLEVNAFLLDDLPQDSRVSQDFIFMDESLGGSKPWELAYWSSDTSKTLWDANVMNEANKIHYYLDSQYPIERMWSPVSFVMYGNQMINGGLNENFTYPTQRNYERSIRAVRSFTKRVESPKLIRENEKYGRFTGFIPEYGSKETIGKNQDLLDYLDKNVDQSLISYRLTGTTYLIDKSHDLLSFNLMKGLLIAIGLIVLILSLYFKSFKILIISLLPNIIPLLITAGYMGFTGISLKLTTAIIFTVAFGIAVDDTIHFIAKYGQLKRYNKVYRLIHTFQSAGSAIITTTVIILSGFVLFLFSSFGATFYLGLFLTLALSSALLIDLTLLPLLLHFGTNKSGDRSVNNT